MKTLNEGDVAVAKKMDGLVNRTFKLRTSEIVALDDKAHELKMSKSIMVRRALKAMYGISAGHRACDVDFDIDKQD